MLKKLPQKFFLVVLPLARKLAGMVVEE